MNYTKIEEPVKGEYPTYLEAYKEKGQRAKGPYFEDVHYMWEQLAAQNKIENKTPVKSQKAKEEKYNLIVKFFEKKRGEKLPWNEPSKHPFKKKAKNGNTRLK